MFTNKNQSHFNINLKEKGRGFALRSVPLALSLSPLPGTFSHKKGGVPMQK